MINAGTNPTVMSEALINDQPVRSEHVSALAARTRAGSPVRVLHLFRYFRPDFTGDGLYFEKMLPLLNGLGIHNEFAAETTKPRGTSPLGVHLFGNGHLRLFNPILLLWLLANAWRFDVVHLHCAVDRHFLYHLIARISRCRVVQSCTLDDGIGSLVDSYRPAYRALVRRLSALVHDVVAISPALHANCATVVSPGRLHMIPQGVTPRSADPSARAAFRARFGFQDADTVLLFVGGLCARKDVRFLVDNHPDSGPLHLLLVGPVLEPGYVEDLVAAIAASPSGARIHLAGYMDDPSPAYLAADLFVFASINEGFGNVLLEAMAHGLPVVCRRLPGITDSFIHDGKTGALFDTACEYSATVRRLVAAPDDRTRLGDAARASVAAEYDLRGAAARYAAIYRGRP